MLSISNLIQFPNLRFWMAKWIPDYTVLKPIQKGSFWKSLTCTQNDLESEKETEFVDVNPPTPGACGSRCKS